MSRHGAQRRYKAYTDVDGAQIFVTTIMPKITDFVINHEIWELKWAPKENFFEDPKYGIKEYTKTL